MIVYDHAHLTSVHIHAILHVYICSCLRYTLYIFMFTLYHYNLFMFTQSFILVHVHVIFYIFSCLRNIFICSCSRNTIYLFMSLDTYNHVLVIPYICSRNILYRFMFTHYFIYDNVHVIVISVHVYVIFYTCSCSRNTVHLFI